MARDVLDLREPPQRVLRLDECPRARALRRALPGGRDRPDRRAGGAPGRDAHDRGEREGDRPRAPGRLHGAARPARRAARDAPQAEHGAVRLRGIEPSRCRRGRRQDPRGSVQARARIRPRHRLPLRWTDGRGLDRAPERDERARSASVGALLLVRAGAPGAGAQGVARRRGERCAPARRPTPTARR